MQNASSSLITALLAETGGSLTPRKCKTPGCENYCEMVELEPAQPENHETGAPAKPAVMGSLSAWCEPCVHRIRREEAEAERIKENRIHAAKRSQWWQQVWGAESAYHATDRKHLPDQAASEKVLRWKPEHPKGILLIGDTGAGKTRSVYLLLKTLLFTRGVYPEIRKCVKLRHEIAKAAMSDTPNAREKLIKRLCDAPVLYLDDLGQMANTPSAEEALLDIVEDRTNRNKHIIATSQYDGERFISLFKTRERGEAIARRLAQHCYRVQFTAAESFATQDEIPFT